MESIGGKPHLFRVMVPIRAFPPGPVHGVSSVMLPIGTLVVALWVYRPFGTQEFALFFDHGGLSDCSLEEFEHCCRELE